MTRLLALAALTALPACAGVDPSDTGHDDTDLVDTDDTDVEEDLRSNVQEGIPPNAEGQEPAFPEQTRAPQPAEPTAFTAEVFADGLEIPWGLAPLPDGRLLVTERAGRLRVIESDGTVGSAVDGVPPVVAVGQGGLLDVAIAPDFSTSDAVFLTYAESRGGGDTAVAVARATLSSDRRRLEDLQVIYRQNPAWDTSRHYGSRLVFDRDGALFVTFGDRGSAFTEAQSPDSAIGAVIRILPDGGIPADNPFADGSEGAPEVWSWGHRNIQAATLGADDALWTVEHGPRGGDELNRPDAGDNHGWPIITYGLDYSGRPVGDGLTALEGLAQPVYYWDPVIAPSGMATYTGSLFPSWHGDLLIGGLQAQALVRLTLRDSRVYTEEWLPVGARARCVAIAQDGAVLVGTDAGQILRLVPDAD